MLMSLMKRLRVVALLNTSAGTIERQGDRALRDALATAFEKRGISAVLQFLPGAGLIRRLLGTRSMASVPRLGAPRTPEADTSRASLARAALILVRLLGARTAVDQLTSAELAG
jgi:hypothetical protein